MSAAITAPLALVLGVVGSQNGCGAGGSVAAVATTSDTTPQQALGDRWTKEQLTIAQTAISVGKAHSIPEKGWIIILAAGLVESNLRNLSSGDRDSQGFLQQRPSSGWGTVQQIRTPSLAAEAFYGVAKHTSNRGLVDVYNWQNKSVGVVAQSVQVSAFPGRYAQREADARALVAQLRGTTAEQPAECASSINAIITTWNCPWDGSDRACVAGVARLGRTSTIINGQEFSSPRRRHQALVALGSRWAMVDDNTPIWYRSDLYDLMPEPDGQNHMLAFGIVHVENAASGTVVGPRNVTYAQFREKATGRRFGMVNTHMMPDPDAGPKRRKVYRDHLQVILGVVRRYRAAGLPVAVAADWNRSQDDRQLAPLAAAGGVPQFKTLGRAATVGKHASFDAFWLFGLTPAAQKVTAITGDHRAMTVMFVSVPDSSTGGGPVPASFDHQGNPRTVEQAVAWMFRQMPDGAPGEPVMNACERYMNLSYGLGGGYPRAIDHWNGPGPRTAGYSTPPRGALVFWRTSNAAGHVALSLGNGQVVSTDYDGKTHRFASGVLSAGPITDIDKWGPRLGWRAPNFRRGAEVA